MNRNEPSNAMALFREYRQTPSIELRNRIVEGYIGLVVDIANALKRTLPKVVDVDELIAFGMPGLIKAVERYDPEQGAAFATFASLRIRGQMIDELRMMEPVSRLALERTKLVKQAKGTFRQDHGRPPTDEELQDTLGVDSHQFDLIRASAFSRVRSLSEQVARDGDRLIGDERNKTMAVMLAAPAGVDPDATMDADNIIRRYTLPRFGLRAALLLRLRYVDGLTLQQVGDALGVTESRASQLHTELLRLLRAKLRPQRRAA